MEIGIRLPGAGAKVSPENIVTAARWAEELGYHSVWVSDHVVLPEKVASFYPYDPQGRWPYPADTPWLDPLLALAWAAAAAPSVKLGTSVMIVPLRHPILLAKQLSSLDFLSRGRVILGVGAGWMEEEFHLIGVPFERRGPRTAEMIALMRAFWSGQTVDFQGDFYQAASCQMSPRPVQHAIPIVWGGHSDAALKRVARVGDGWHPTQISLEQLAEGMGKLRRFCQEAGRDPASVLVIARPGRVYPINAETQARHEDLGIQHLVIDPPLDGPDLSNFRAEMERVAGLCGLEPRS
ncbi:MAG: TIGR03619 family F420-dependent LLM class oxidoreductase [Anaerolineales bacterium]|nr:TIGR03619 family F420-dependent LLM class oxidoreductase [Anaerolineales bacterium]